MCLPLLAVAACAKKDAEPAPAPPPAKVPAPPPAPPDAAPAKPQVTDAPVQGLATPESVIIVNGDTGIGDAMLVSNINGDPMAADDNGFISKLDENGNVVALKWIDGAQTDVTLHAPKGLAIWGEWLYVADLDRVRLFDLKTGAAKGEVVIKGATFLNDVAAGAEYVYVSDSGLGPGFKPSGTDAVYRLDPKQKNAVKKIASGDELARPNGLLVDGDKVWVAPYGSKQLYRVDSGKKTDAFEVPTGGLDGLVSLGDGRVAVTSWDGKAVYVGKLGGAFTALVSDFEAPADLAFDAKHQRLVIPAFVASALRFVRLD
jgi:hypothetical protein